MIVGMNTFWSPALLRRAVGPLRLFLALTFVLLVVLQTLSFPGQFAHMADEEPDLAHLRWPLTALAATLILCLQVVIACTWKLLGMVERDRIFRTDALRFVDIIIGAIAVGWLLFCGVWLWVGFTADDPGLPLVLTLVALAGGALGLLVVVMRSLLQQAIELRTDMDSVI